MQVKKIACHHSIINAFYILFFYISIETIVKLIHETGHIIFALFLGFPLDSITLYLNPFSGGYTGIEGFGADRNLNGILFALSGTILPVVLGVIVCFYCIIRKPKRQLQWSLFAGYAFLINGINVCIGVFIQDSDTALMVQCGLPLLPVLFISLILILTGSFVLVRYFFMVCLHSYFKTISDRIILLLIFCISPMIAIVTAYFVDDLSFQRVFIALGEVVFVVLFFVISIFFAKQKNYILEREKIPVFFDWFIVFPGMCFSVYFYIDYIFYR
ncbi:MAG: hypothetical protein A2015_08480 [Spirochaetes bacterium GWF1_31_7]|nr:MAG: hypothetical protein A2Y30_08675 [Spirochaetes bacterium GWE1_32_154]OHD47182.1 MAG: hypothetical protein A2015_08480 [Spirochaetes bacterium GWF1_31_7]OHD47493.1 MAG: hypothetical protein A2Y29_08900 [Spirochaetes bacterium GWE2_31_10]OHD82327.1 MAG: hypothetical protein A2355_15310 [Spirochaetes bacterium RIFOXYB1_FULL_32_8]